MGMEDCRLDLNGNDTLAAMMGSMITLVMVHSRGNSRQDCLPMSHSVVLRIATVDFPESPNGQIDLDDPTVHVYPMKRQVVHDQAHKRTLTVLG